MKEAAIREGDPCLKTRREKVEELIGKELSEKHRAIEALLDLIDYRMEDLGNNYRYGISRMFVFDTLYGKKAVTRIIARVLSPVLWAVSKTKNRAVPKAETRLVFANTFLRSIRYPAARKQIEQETGLTAVLSFTDLLKQEGPEQRINLKGSLKPEVYPSRPVYFRGTSICGGALQKAVTRYCELMYNPAGTENRTKDAVEKAAQALETAYLKRVERVVSCLRKEDCTAYITVNQYNLRDLLIIHACKNLGIRTAQMEHHATQFNRVQFDEHHPMPRLAFAGEYGFWNKSEQLFHEKVYRYENPLYRPEEIRFRVTGNPEITLEQAEEVQQKYPTERKLTFMIGALQQDQLEGFEAEYEKWRWEVFRGLRELAKRQNVIINIRYTPYQELEMRKKEEPVLREWGFQVSDSVPADLMQDLCSSAAIMSSVSSVLSTAQLFGKMIFRVEDMQIGYVHVDDTVNEVDLKDIPDIVIPEGIEKNLPGIDREGTFNIRKML